MHQQSIKELKQIANNKKWGNNQLKEVLSHFEDFVIILTDPLQQISYTSNGFEKMTGNTSEEAKDRNLNFYRGLILTNNMFNY